MGNDPCENIKEEYGGIGMKGKPFVINAHTFEPDFEPATEAERNGLNMARAATLAPDFDGEE